MTDTLSAITSHIRRQDRMDYGLLWGLITLGVTGVVMIYSATRQLWWMRERIPTTTWSVKPFSCCSASSRCTWCHGSTTAVTRSPPRRCMSFRSSHWREFSWSEGRHWSRALV